MTEKDQRAEPAPQERSELKRREAEELFSRGELDEALAACSRALDEDPAYHRALYLKGVILARLGNLDDAIASLEGALLSQTEYPEALRALAAIQHRRGELQGAAKAYCRAIELGADGVDVRFEWANLAERLGDLDEAILQRREIQRRAPDLEENNFVLAGLTGEKAPGVAPSSFVAPTFDKYAETFDSHLGALQYRAPELVAALVEKVCSSRELAILDLGCGTGLCGEWLKRIARRLVGVDLSAGMVEKARERGIYDELHVDDLTQFLAGTDGFDVVVAADVFVYVGDLAPAFSGARGALADRGCFVFTVERGEDEDFRVNRNHRYEHSEEYIRRLAAETGFAVASLEHEGLRRHLGEEVRGLVVALRRS